MIDTVLFDLDGTLTDPQQGITKSVQYALRSFGIEVKDLHELDRFIGPPLSQSFEEFYDFSKFDALKAVDVYREYFSEKGLFENQVYRGIRELLTKLKTQGFRLAVATSKPTVFAEKILSYFDLSTFFEAIIGSNLDNTRTDKAEVISHALKVLAPKDPASVIMVGDRRFDLIGARINGLKAIGVLYGYGSLAELEGENPEYIAGSVTELGSILLKESAFVVESTI